MEQRAKQRLEKLQQNRKVMVGGREYTLRPPSPFIARMVQPNVLLEVAQDLRHLTPENLEDASKRMENVLAIIVEDPPLYTMQGVDDAVPPGHVPTYTINMLDALALLEAYLEPYAGRMQELKDDAGPFSPGETTS